MNEAEKRIIELFRERTEIQRRVKADLEKIEAIEKQITAHIELIPTTGSSK